jgi:ribosomal protein S18 acetylase RimI-like enzyme
MIQLKTVSTLEDVQLIVPLAKEIWTEHYTPIIGAKQVHYMLNNLQSEDAILADLSIGKHYLLVESDQLIIGYVSYEMHDDQLFLSKLYLKKSERGKGIGRLILEALKDTAQKNKKEAIVLTVNKNNHASIAAYQALGFQLIKEQCIEIGGGYVMDDYVFRYHLSN